MTPLNGEFRETMMKIAAETARAQTISIKITFGVRGAKSPKLKKMMTSHDVTTARRENDIAGCSDLRNINQ